MLRGRCGRANGANYFVDCDPCHRVIEANGKLRGYGGGLWRKQYLIELESRRPTETLDFSPAVVSTTAGKFIDSLSQGFFQNRDLTGMVEAVLNHSVIEMVEIESAAR